MSTEINSTPDIAGNASNAGDGINAESQRTVRQTIVSHLEAPRLERITTAAIVDFCRLRTIYEQRVAEKNAEPGVKISATSYKSSVSLDVQHLFILAGWVSASKVSELTEQLIKGCIDERAVVEPSKYDLARLETEISKLVLDDSEKQANLSNQVLSMVLKYKKLLTSFGYEDFESKQAKLSVEHVLNILPNATLRKRMALNLRLRKDELEEDFRKFVQECGTEAEAIERHEVVKKIEDPASSFEWSKPRLGDQNVGRTILRGKKMQKKSGEKADAKKRDASKKADGSSSKRDRDLPDCLHQKCKGKHFINDCPVATEDEKKKLKKEYHDAKRARLENQKKSKGGVRAVVSGDPDNTSLFAASFCSGAVEVDVMADQGSDMSAIPKDILEAIMKADPSVHVEKLDKAFLFETAVSDAEPLRCTRRVELDVELRIRHGEKLILRGVKWLVPDNNIAHVYLGRHVLRALGLDNRVLLAAARDRLGTVIEVPQLLRDSGASDTAYAHDPKSICNILQSRNFEWGSSFHSSPSDEEPHIDDDIYVDIGEDTAEELQAALRSRIDEAAGHGLTARGRTQLEQIISCHREIFRIRLGNSPPAKVEPMHIRLDPNCRPVRAKARRYSQEQRKFLDKYVETLQDLDFVVEVTTATWQAAPLLVPKKGAAKFRLTVDLRPVNSATIKEDWPMPHVDSEVLDFANSTCFAVVDFASGYWQLPLHPDSYDACGIVTPKGVVASKRVLQGLANATAHFQRTIEPLFASLREHVKAWLDDFIIHAENEEKLLEVLDTFCRICGQHGLFLSAKKSTFFTREIKWCGRVVSGEGYRMDPSRTEALNDMHQPDTAAELGEFIYCLRWMSISIPNFAERVAPLNQILEEAYSRSGRRTKRSIQGIKLATLSWGATHVANFNDLKDSLVNAVTLSYPDSQRTVCVYSDASDRFWSAVVTQITSDQLKLPLKDQRHQPLAFLGAAFKGAQLGWSTFEKEAFAVFSTFEKLDYMLLGHTSVRVFTDHRNLLFVFAPLSLEPSLGRHIVSKVQRWALYLSKFSYVIEHVSGSDNVFADILTRWLKGYRGESARSSICSMSLSTDQVVPTADELHWPTVQTFRDAQELVTQKPRGVKWDPDARLWKNGNQIWLPDGAVELQLKVMVASHCGQMGHRGATATTSIVKESFWWRNMARDISELIKGCLHCMVTRTGSMVPRPLGSALHGNRPNEVVHMDYLYMGPACDDKLYLFLIRDDLSGYVWLWPTDSCTSEAAAEALSVWIGVFGPMTWLVSDQGTHFKNKLVREMLEDSRVRHHFTTAYCPWANGSIERICRDVLTACKALLAEFGLPPKSWPRVTECAQSVLNHAPRQRLGPRNKGSPGVYRTPLEVFTGQRPVRPLLQAFPPVPPSSAAGLSEVRARQLVNIEELGQALDDSHRDVQSLMSKSRERAIELHNKRTGATAARFDVGDFVLVRRGVPGKHKLSFDWVGPRRVVEVKSDWVFIVEDLLRGDRRVAHARRLILYRADMDGQPVSPSLLSAAHASESTIEIAHALHSIREEHGSLEVLVEWEGLPDDVDRTWEPVSQIHEDLPGILEDFLHSQDQRQLKLKALESFFGIH